MIFSHNQTTHLYVCMFKKKIWLANLKLVIDLAQPRRCLLSFRFLISSSFDRLAFKSQSSATKSLMFMCGVHHLRQLQLCFFFAFLLISQGSVVNLLLLFVFFRDSLVKKSTFPSLLNICLTNPLILLTIKSFLEPCVSSRNLYIYTCCIISRN